MKKQLLTAVLLSFGFINMVYAGPSEQETINFIEQKIADCGDFWKISDSDISIGGNHLTYFYTFNNKTESQQELKISELSSVFPYEDYKVVLSCGGGDSCVKQTLWLSGGKEVIDFKTRAVIHTCNRKTSEKITKALARLLTLNFNKAEPELF